MLAERRRYPGRLPKVHISNALLHPLIDGNGDLEMGALLPPDASMATILECIQALFGESALRALDAGQCVDVETKRQYGLPLAASSWREATRMLLADGTYGTHRIDTDFGLFCRTLAAAKASEGA